MGKQQLNIRVSPELMTEVKHCIADRRINLTKFVILAIEKELLKEM